MLEERSFSSSFVENLNVWKEDILDNLMIDKMLRGNRWVSAKTGRNYNFLHDFFAALTVPWLVYRTF